VCICDQFVSVFCLIIIKTKTLIHLTINTSYLNVIKN